MRLDDVDRLTDLEILVSDLARRVAELEDKRQPSRIPQAVARAATGMPEMAPAKAKRERAQCPDCKAKMWPSQLATHICRPVPSASVPIQTDLSDAECRRRMGVPEEWRCAACGFYTRAQSLKNPDYCTSCARAQPIGVLRERAA